MMKRWVPAVKGRPFHHHVGLRTYSVPTDGVSFWSIYGPVPMLTLAGSKFAASLGKSQSASAAEAICEGKGAYLSLSFITTVSGSGVSTESMRFFSAFWLGETDMNRST